MRIISKNRDYYDSALSFGHDPSVVFERFEDAFWIDRHGENTSHGFMAPQMYADTSMRRLLYGTNNSRTGWEFGFFPFTVAFCGKTYPGIEIHYAKAGSFEDPETKCFYDFESYTEQLHRFGLEYTEGRRRSYSWDKHPKTSPRCEDEVKDYFATTGVDHVSLFAELRQPIAVCHFVPHNPQLSVSLNVVLADYDFYKVFDAYTAFQELDMFVSGIMARDNNPMADISDVDMRDKKGFDNMSFKKAPTKRR